MAESWRRHTNPVSPTVKLHATSAVLYLFKIIVHRFHPMIGMEVYYSVFYKILETLFEVNLYSIEETKILLLHIA